MGHGVARRRGGRQYGGWRVARRSAARRICELGGGPLDDAADW
uniref:Uncharacterized protein n=1 Tax=Arundo donax TaxID=35708 RepID=A0A0A9BBM2_ARUDO